MVPMQMLGSSCYEGVETRGLDNETHLCVERLPQWAVAALDTMLEEDKKDNFCELLL
jgi:hypothetical protein